MTGLVDSATAVMRMAQARLDVAAHNIANVATPGYKRRIGFADTVAARSEVALATRIDAAQASLTETGNVFDMAISGDGYFRVRDGERTLYTRQGQFRRDADGALVTPQGYVLQQSGGGDLVIDGAKIDLARIAVERCDDPAGMTAVGESFFAGQAMVDTDRAEVRSGMLEASNVTLGDEMTQTMVAMRQAESGARLIQLYDELMGRAAATFGGKG